MEVAVQAAGSTAGHHAGERAADHLTESAAEREIAFSDDVAGRVRLAAAPGTAPEILYHLARDPVLTVRAAVALNAATPGQAREILATDHDDRVRALLGRALATLAGAPTTTQVTADRPDGRLCRRAADTLATLVEDTAVRVRAAIADALAEMPGAPRELVLRLAHDTAVPVSEPIVRLSPLLTSEDLLRLLGDPPTTETATAVARRPHLNVSVSAAIAATGDTAAIRALLSNPSAAIQEETLDALIARATTRVDWHEPLVLRPALPPAAAHALAGFVATHLLHYMTTRPDLDPSVIDALRARLEQRLAAEASPQTPAGPPSSADDDRALAEAEALARAGRLNESSLIAALRAGEPRRIAARLAVAADMTLGDVDRAVALRSAKALVSLLWQAGFTMKPAVALQTILANIAPNRAITAGPGGEYPLSVEEMRWQIDFLRRSTG